jgi:hypothetical protein
VTQGIHWGRGKWTLLPLYIETVACLISISNKVVEKCGTQKLPKKLSKCAFLSTFSNFGGKKHFLKFSQKNPVLKRVKRDGMFFFFARRNAGPAATSRTHRGV